MTATIKGRALSSVCVKQQAKRCKCSCWCYCRSKQLHVSMSGRIYGSGSGNTRTNLQAFNKRMCWQRPKRMQSKCWLHRLGWRISMSMSKWIQSTYEHITCLIDYLIKLHCYQDTSPAGGRLGSVCLRDFCASFKDCPQNTTCVNREDKAYCQCLPDYIDIASSKRRISLNLEHVQ